MTIEFGYIGSPILDEMLTGLNFTTISPEIISSTEVKLKYYVQNIGTNPKHVTTYVYRAFLDKVSLFLSAM